MPISIHVRGPGVRKSRARPDDDGALDVAVEAAIGDVFAELRRHDQRFSPFRTDSELSRLQRGDVPLAEASEDIREVERLCRTALERTEGLFDAWNAVPGRPGVFDPTGLVKSWAVGRASRRMRPVTDAGLSWVINAGGDVLVGGGQAASSGAVEPWVVGIEDPLERSRILAQVPVDDGAVATSGLAARGAHILDPRTGAAAGDVAAATVVGPSLLWADVFATALVARGRGAGSWAETLHGTSGLIVFSDGRVRRWANPD